MPLRIVGGVYLGLGLLGLILDFFAPPRVGEFPERPGRWAMFVFGATLLAIGGRWRRRRKPL